MKKLTLKLALTLILLVHSVSAICSDEVLVKGSDTLLNLVQQLSEVYMNNQAGATISVVGGGSGVGIAALIDGNVDVANASRKIKDKEVKKANDNGIKPVEIVIAIDGLAVIVNPENSTEKLTVEQLGSIYRGETKNWKEVGGPDMKINLYGRQPSSGTFVFFRDFVLKGDYSPRMRQMTGNAQIVDAVKHDKSAVGYVGLGYVKGAKGLSVLSIGKRNRDRQIRYISPLVFISPLKPGQKKPEPTDYPLTRPLFQYTNGVPTGVARDFIRFELGDKGQEIVEEVGFLRLSEKQVAENLQIIGGSH
jgi:phosphate transport system substrate-binding protein